MKLRYTERVKDDVELAFALLPIDWKLLMAAPVCLYARGK